MGAYYDEVYDASGEPRPHRDEDGSPTWAVQA
jgi:hypothetical protein